MTTEVQLPSATHYYRNMERNIEGRTSFKEDLLNYYALRGIVVFGLLSFLGMPPSISMPATLGVMGAHALDRELRK